MKIEEMQKIRKKRKKAGVSRYHRYCKCMQKCRVVTGIFLNNIRKNFHQKNKFCPKNDKFKLVIASLVN